MKPSKKDKWVDRIISQTAEANRNKPVPDFGKWLKEHPDAVQNLKSQADRSLSRSRHSHESFMLKLPRLAWGYGIAALFLIGVLSTACIILVSENRTLRHDLQFARQEFAMNNQQQKIVEAQNNKQQAISELHTRVKKLEQDVHRGISPRMAWFLEEPYYTPEYQEEL